MNGARCTARRSSRQMENSADRGTWEFRLHVAWFSHLSREAGSRYLCVVSQVLKLLLFSHSVMSDSLQPHGLQHSRLPCPSLSPRVCSNSMESVMPSNHLILCHPLLLLPSVFPSIRVFSNESALRIRWPKYWSFSFIISPSNGYPGTT